MKKLTVIFLLVIHIALLSNLQFTAWPEMLSYAYLVNNGFKLYTDFIHPYPPFLTIVLAGVYKLFGYKLIVLKAFTWFLMLTTDVLVYLLGGFWAVLFFVLIQPFLDGNMLWFDFATVPFVLLGLLLLTKALPVKRRVGIAGLAFGVAALIKQTAGIFLILPFLFKKNKGRTLVYLKWPIVLGVLLLVYLVAAGSFEQFVDWVFLYPLLKWSSFPGYVEMSMTNKQVLILMLLSFPVIYYWRKKRELVLPLFFLGALLSVYPRFSFFHLQLGIALSAVAAGIALRKKAVFVLVLLLPLIPIQWSKANRFYSKEDVELAKRIDTETEGSVYLQGLASSLYVYGEFLPPKPWSDNFEWYLEISGVQEDILKRWVKLPPEYVVRSKLDDTKLGSYRPKLISDWIDTNYTYKGDIEESVGIWQRND